MHLPLPPLWLYERNLSRRRLHGTCLLSLAHIAVENSGGEGAQYSAGLRL